MKTLEIDIETYSDVDLGKCGVYRYCESPQFEIMLFGYSIAGTKGSELYGGLDIVSDYIFPECVNHADKSVLNKIREAKYKHCRECLKTGFQQFVTMKTKSSMTRNMRHSDSMPYALEL